MAALKHSHEIMTGLSVALSGFKNQSGWDAWGDCLEDFINQLIQCQDMQTLPPRRKGWHIIFQQTETILKPTTTRLTVFRNAQGIIENSELNITIKHDKKETQHSTVIKPRELRELKTALIMEEL